MCMIHVIKYIHPDGRLEVVETPPRLCEHRRGKTCPNLQYTTTSEYVPDPGSPSFSVASPSSGSAGPSTPVPAIREIRPSIHSEDSRPSSGSGHHRRKSKSYPLRPELIITIGSSKKGKDREKAYNRRSTGSTVFSSGSSDVGSPHSRHPPSNPSSPRTTNIPRSSTYATAGPSSSGPPSGPPRNRRPATEPAGSPPPGVGRGRHPRESPVIHNSQDNRGPAVLGGAARDRARSEERRRQRETDRITQANIQREQEDARRERARMNVREDLRQASRLEQEQNDRRAREEALHRTRRQSDARAMERDRLRNFEREPRVEQRSERRVNDRGPPTSMPLPQPDRRRRSSASQNLRPSFSAHGRDYSTSQLIRPDLAATLRQMEAERAVTDQQEHETAQDARYNPRAGASFNAHSAAAAQYNLREALPSHPAPSSYMSGALGGMPSSTEDPLLAHGEQVLQAARDERAVRAAARDMHSVIGAESSLGGGFGGTLRRSNTHGGGNSRRRGSRSQYQGSGC